jgi:hypothetical protein
LFRRLPTTAEPPQACAFPRGDEIWATSGTRDRDRGMHAVIERNNRLVRRRDGLVIGVKHDGPHTDTEEGA